MEIKHQTKIVYRIEPKPEGGFIARATDPGVPPIEAATQEELQRKIQAKISAALGSELAGLKLPFGSKQVSVQIERKPGTSITFHSTGASAQPAEEVNDARELVEFIAKDLPELSEVLAERKKEVTINVAPQRLRIVTQALLPTGAVRADGREAMTNDVAINAEVPTLANAPITPETESSWKILRLLLVLLALAALVYFLHH